MMKTIRYILTAVLAVTVLTANAEPPKSDYSYIRGFCYPSGWRADKATLQTELGYARRVDLNSARIWLNYGQYQRDPQAFLHQLVLFVRTAHAKGISTMPIFFNGNGLNPETLKPVFRKEADLYVKAVIDALKNEPGLIMWDVMNEPACNDYYIKASEDQKQVRLKEIYDFVRYYCKKIKEYDPVNAVTVGEWLSEHLHWSADLVDVLSFHDYSETRAKAQAAYDIAIEVSKNNDNKQVINSEMACIGRGNPYDMSLELCGDNGMGWYIFELMIHGYWADIHGVFYADGTVRDPSIVAALMGFYRKRDLTTAVHANPNKEGYANRALKAISAALTDDHTIFRNRRATTDDILEAAEIAANLLEASEMVPMYDPPTAKIQTWRAIPEAERNADEIRDFAYQLALELKKWCRIL